MDCCVCAELYGFMVMGQVILDQLIIVINFIEHKTKTWHAVIHLSLAFLLSFILSVSQTHTVCLRDKLSTPLHECITMCSSSY